MGLMYVTVRVKPSYRSRRAYEAPFLVPILGVMQLESAGIIIDLSTRR